MKKIAPPLFVVLAVLLVFHGALGYFFTQDDLVWLRISENFSRFIDVMKVFVQYNGAGNYRPLTQELFFLLNLKLFGLNPVAFHASALLIQVINALLVYAILQRLFGNRFASMAGAVFYGANATLFISVYWVSAVSESGMATFFLLSVFFFIRFLKETKARWYLLSFVSFIAAIMSKEAAIAVPPVLLLMYMYLKPEMLRIKPDIWRDWLKLAVHLLPFGLVVIAYLVIRALTIGMTPEEGPYNASFGAHTLGNLKTYLIWSLNGFQLTDALGALTGIWNRQFYAIPGYILLLALLVYYIRFHARTLLLAACWFLVAMLPVLPFSDHVQNYYVNIATVAFSILIAVAVSKTGRVGRYIAGVGIPVYLVISMINVDYQEEHSWVTRRAEIARTALDDIKALYPTLPTRAVLYFTNTGEEEYWAWNFGDLYRLYYHDNRLVTLFADRDTMPANTGNVIELEMRGGHLIATGSGANDGDAVSTAPALPEVIDFSEEGTPPGLGGGWHQAETGHRWATRRSVVFFPAVRGVETRYTLTILGSLNVDYYEDRMVQLNITANGRTIGSASFNETGGFTVEQTFEGVFTDDIEIVMVLDKSYSPSEVGNSTDTRDLGMSVTYISLHPE